MIKPTYRHLEPWHIALFGALALVPACGSSSSADADAAAGQDVSQGMTLEEVSNGFGQLVPHTIQKLDAAGNPTPQLVSIRSFQDLVDNARLDNLVLPVPQFQPTAVLPTGAAGNQFLYASFTQPIDIATVLDPSPGGQANSGLTGAISVIAIDPLTGDALPVIGRAFIDGRTYAGAATGNPPVLELQRWVRADPATGKPVALLPEGFGFPGTEGDFNGSELLVSKKTIVFVPDADGDLSTYETFPLGRQIRMEISTAVRSTLNKSLAQRVLGCSTVGADYLSPEIITTPPPLNAPKITPGNGDVNVDPLTAIRVEFSEPVQPLSVGDLDDGSPPGLSSSIKVEFGPSASRTDMPFSVRPISIFDLSVFELIPAFNFPGAGPEFESCDTFAQVDITINSGQLEDLAANPDPNDDELTIPNNNLLGASTNFITGEGPGLVNAPVLPDVVFVARTGAQPGLSLVDMNGFGQSTGNPTFIEGASEPEHSNFPNNPNVRFQTGLRPPLSVGTCTIDGGSAGVFTLTRDSSLRDLVVRAPLIANVSDMMVGHALDGTFNNAQFPFGCQSGGGSICTLDGFKVIAPAASNPNTLTPQQTNQFGGLNAGAENIISWAPHPNPPPLTFPPLCVAPFLGADEPTSVDNTLLPPVKQNLLVPGDPFGSPLSDPQVPPSGLLTPEQNAFFLGPSQGQTNIDNCQIYQIRQQIGHYLYIIDRQRREITVLNSNRMTIIDRIDVPDPTSLAMGTNLDFLAVTNQQADTVSFIDINPNSASFHTVVKNTVVGNGPRGIAWEPGNEDILVCNEIDNSLSIISAFSLEVRKVISSQLNGPFDVCVFPRMVGFAFNRGVYFAYILNRSGNVAMFESGPNGVNGWGFDDVIGIAPFEFKNPKTIQPDPNNLQAAAWVVHEGPIDTLTGQVGPVGEGALSLLFIESGNGGQLPLGTNFTNPQFRSLQLGVQVSLGSDKLSGVPVDIAFDNQRNFGGLQQVTTTFSAGAGITFNGKGLIRVVGPIVNANEAQFMLAAVPNASGGSGVIDVFEVGAAGVPKKDVDAYEPGVQSIEAPNVTGVMDYWRQ